MNEAFLHDQVRPEQMDALCAKGWRHFGSTFFRYDRTREDGCLRHVTPLRVRLAAFSPRRNQRRALKRNEDLTLQVTPAFVDRTVVSLFERHKVRFSRNVPDSLFTFISRDPARVPCPCVSLCLYDRARLVGISYLDVGEVACSSVYQFFDPQEARRSLGVLMILLSIRAAQAWGKTLYYPGYAYLEPSHYDYKKQLSGLEVYDWSHWSPLAREKPSTG